MSTYGTRRRRLLNLKVEVVQSWDDDGYNVDPLGPRRLHVQFNDLDMEITIQRSRRWTGWRAGDSFGWRTPFFYIDGGWDTWSGAEQIEGDFPRRP